jgi:hypothetical protein
MRKLFSAAVVMLLCIGVFSAGESSADVKSPTTVAATLLSSADPIRKLNLVTLKPGAIRKKRVKQLLASLDAIRDKGLYMSPRYRMKIVNAALHAQAKTGVDATLMLAVARMESDFRSLTLINAACKYGRRKVNCYADCGMTQHHVRGSMAYVTKYCAKLKRNIKLSFLKSAQELARHIKWCQLPKHLKRDGNVRRCVLNRYNQGPAYKTYKKCKRWHNPWRGWTRLRRYSGETRRQHRIRMRKLMKTPDWKRHYRAVMKQQWKCRHRAAYWTKLTCFEYGARSATKSKRSCRRCTSLSQIRTKFYAPAAVKTTSPMAYLFAK